MKAPKRLNADGVRQWLVGQAAAGMVIEKERREWLCRLDSEDSLRLYLALTELPGEHHLANPPQLDTFSVMPEYLIIRGDANGSDQQ